VSDTVITATTPPDSAGSSDVIVDNPSFPGTLNPPSDYYTFLDQPTVTNVASPQSEGATGITVTGTNFSIPGPPTTSAVTEVDLVPTFTGPTVALRLRARAPVSPIALISPTTRTCRSTSPRRTSRPASTTRWW
jgi:hypothetical protein